MSLLPLTSPIRRAGLIYLFIYLCIFDPLDPFQPKRSMNSPPKISMG